MKNYQLDYASKRPQMYDIASRTLRAERTIKALEYIVGGKQLKKLHLLDIGASTGIIDNYVSDYVQDVVGSDIDESAIKFATKNFKKHNLHFEIQDAMNLKFKSNSFDIVLCTQVYEHIPDPAKMLAEVYRVLKPEGICYFSALNSLRLIEPHYNLPFLSWLPKNLADYYVKYAKRANNYYETPRNYWQLKRLCKKFEILELTEKILTDPLRFGYENEINWSVRIFTKAFSPIGKYLAPNFIWILKKTIS